MTFFTFKSKKTIRAADRLRDQKKWPQAIALYKKVLRNPLKKRKRFAVLKQLGNCYKDNGNFSWALITYGKATEFFPNDSDLHLQVARAFTMLGNKEQALCHYEKSLSLDPCNKSTSSELKRFPRIDNETTPEFKIKCHEKSSYLQTIWLDMTDLLQYVRINNSLSGIQRVVANLVLYIKEANIPQYRIVPIIPDYYCNMIFSIELDSLLELIYNYDDLYVCSNKIKKCLDEIDKSRSAIVPKKDDIIMVAGAFWIYPHYDTIMHMRQKGVYFGLFIHDLIQIRMPEYVESAAHYKFVTQFSDALDLADFLLTNSEYVAQDVRDFIAQKKNYTLPVEAVVLPTELRTRTQRTDITDTDILRLSKVDYVLCVSTIEIRKNHALLIRVWEKLHKELEGKVPKLVFIGKWGWQIEEFRRYIEEKKYTNKWLYIFNGISDTEMEFIYKNSIFTIYPSFAEGFGLPIGESLIYGKPCIASATTSMPEVGGKFVRYIDPFDWEASYPVIKKAIINRKDLAQWQQWIERDFCPKTWNDFSREFYDTIIQNAQSLNKYSHKSSIALPSSKLILGGTHDILRMTHLNEEIITWRAARYKNWNPATYWGAWSQNKESKIVFATELHVGDKVDIFLRLHAQTSHENTPIALLDAGYGEYFIRMSEEATFFKISGKISQNGLLHIRFNAYENFQLTEKLIGLSGLAYCLHDDPAALEQTYKTLFQPASLLSENLTNFSKKKNILSTMKFMKENIYSIFHMKGKRIPKGIFGFKNFYKSLHLTNFVEEKFSSVFSHYLEIYPGNDWNIWSYEEESRIDFFSECHEGEIVTIFLRLHSDCEHDQQTHVILDADDGNYEVFLTQHPNIFNIQGKVHRKGRVTIRFNVKKEPPSAEKLINWSGIAYFPSEYFSSSSKNYDTMITQGEIRKAL